MALMQEITFITGNAGKAEEVSRFLGMPIRHVALDIQEIQSLDPEEIVREKATRTYERLGQPILVEDVSLVFRAFDNKLPGPFIKWFEKALGSEALCRLVDGKDRSCTGSVLYGYHDGKEIHLIEGSMAGSVADHPQGGNSFGWANIFIPDGMTKTYAELTHAEQEPIAMRRKALEKFRALLN